VSRLGQPVVNVVLSAGELETVGAEQLLALHHLPDLDRFEQLPPGAVKCVPLSVSTV
jgi:hypothetical protein